jgi:hypothetical protein
MFRWPLLPGQRHSFHGHQLVAFRLFQWKLFPQALEGLSKPFGRSSFRKTILSGLGSDMGKRQAERMCQ